ncbi:hypothetical protein ACFLYP_04220, partial [Chloroflexota bacterium]
FREYVLSFLNWKNTFPPEQKRAYLERWGVDIPENASSEDLNKIALQNRDKVPVTYKERKAEAAFIQNSVRRQRSLDRISEKIMETF